MLAAGQENRPQHSAHPRPLAALALFPVAQTLGDVAAWQGQRTKPHLT